MHFTILTPTIALSSVLALTFSSRLLAADIIVGAIVTATKQIALDQIDHSAWDGLLKKYVDAKGMVNYKTWKASSGDSQTLEQYLVHLSHWYDVPIQKSICIGQKKVSSGLLEESSN
jgi:hypothetical protein